MITWADDDLRLQNRLWPSRRRDCHSMAPPVNLLGVSIGINRGCQWHDSLADGYFGPGSCWRVRFMKAAMCFLRSLVPEGLVYLKPGGSVT